jgi:hypothetical protein
MLERDAERPTDGVDELTREVVEQVVEPPLPLLPPEPGLPEPAAPEPSAVVLGTLPRVGIRFPGFNSTLSLITPPDTMGAIGPRHFMEVINGNVSVYDRRSGLRVSRVSLPSFFSIVSGFKFDPRVLYDAPSGRWIASAARSPGNTPEPFGICLGVSRTDDPLGDWYQVFVYDALLPSTLHDFPMLGVGPKGIYVGALVSDTETSKNLWAFDKAALMGNPPSPGTITLWRFAVYLPQPVPVHSQGALGADLVTTVHPLTGSIAVYFVDGTPQQPILRSQGVTLVIPTESVILPAPSPDVYETAGLPSGPYLGTVPVFRNRNLWFALRVQVDFRNAVNWTRINPFAVPPRVLESTTVSHPTLHLTYPSLAVNAVTNLTMGFSATDASTFVGAYYTGRLSTDPPGSYAPITLLKAGEAAYGTTQTVSRRWGDYSNTSVDPIDDLTFWTIQQYAGFREQKDTWGLWVSALSFGLTDCNGNQREDACDIDCAADGCFGICGTSLDCQQNGVPDECETPSDCNDNGEVDSCEVYAGTVPDCNQNGRPDECDPSSDCNENDIPDECELDCNANSVPDDCDLAAGAGHDCNENGRLDECERRPNFLVESDPPAGRTLGRSSQNTICLSFRCDISPTVRLGRDLSVAELMPGGTFGADITGGFELIRRDTRTVCLIDRLSRLQPGHWYAMSNPGWDGVQGFSLLYPVLVGDVDGNGWVLSSDFARLNAVIPTAKADLFDRRDVNADGTIDEVDGASVLSWIPKRTPAKPAGHQ